MTAKADTTGEVREEVGDRRSLIETWTEVIADASGLFQAEARLARAETATNLRAMLRNTIIILIGLVLIMVAVTFLSVAAVVGLASLIGLGWALVSVAAVCSIAGAVLVVRGQARVETLKILPDQSIRRVSADLQRLSSRGRDVPTSAGDMVSGDLTADVSGPGPRHREQAQNGGIHEAA